MQTCDRELDDLIGHAGILLWVQEWPFSPPQAVKGCARETNKSFGSIFNGHMKESKDTIYQILHANKLTFSSQNKVKMIHSHALLHQSWSLKSHEACMPA